MVETAKKEDIKFDPSEKEKTLVSLFLGDTAIFDPHFDSTVLLKVE